MFLVINMQQFLVTHAWSLPFDKHPHTGSEQQWHTTNRRPQRSDIS